MLRLRLVSIAVVLVAFLSTQLVSGQSTNASVAGYVTDPSKAFVTDAKVIMINTATNLRYEAVTNKSGAYNLSNLPPGPYRIEVEKSGFRTVVKSDVALHVQDAIQINFDLSVGSASEVITVEGGAPLVNTETAAVSTVVDRKFVENLPMNGRSLQDLILLTPGIVTNSPQSGARSGDLGEFSVNGQRTESNYYLVDGVAANLGVNAGQVLSAGNSGSLAANTALGTTQTLVSLDALEEFRVQSSTYSAEFGRNPGAQFSFLTRSGTNQWHGSAFDYLRNDVFDASDWFNGYYGQPKPPLRQNDFGGTLGGPILIPGVYNGKDRTFFFVSYEGLRLSQPQPASVSTVPTIALRQSVPSAVQPVLNAFPLPNCPAAASNCTADFGDGLGQFIGSWSNPGSIDSFSIRVDHFFNERWKAFFRLSDALSSQGLRRGGDSFNPSMINYSDPNVQTYTLGVTSAISPRSNNEFRLNYSRSSADTHSQTSTFGGAQVANIAGLHGVSQQFYDFSIYMGFSSYSHNTGLEQYRSRGLQKQWNITDAVSSTIGRHTLKLGMDYRRLGVEQQFSSPLVFYEYDSQGSLNANNSDFAYSQSTAAVHPHFVNFSAFAQDEWHTAPKLNISFGVRWEVNPAPGADKNDFPYTVQGDIDSPATLSVAPQGTSLWRTSWYNFAPRLGIAYAIRDSASAGTVLRGGIGVFYDTGQQQGTFGYNGTGFTGTSLYCPAGCDSPAVFPLTASQLSPPITPPPPAGLLYGFAPHLQLPYTLQWNVSVQQGLGRAQALTVSYVGAAARRLLQHEQLNLNGVNSNIGTLLYIKNGLTSDYNSLQVQMQRRIDRGLQMLASYTWSHSIDYGSNDSAFAYRRGSSDFDVRHNVSVGLSYDLPQPPQHPLTKAILANWGIDDRFTARSGFPLPLNGPRRVDTATLQSYNAGLDLVPENSLYIYSAQLPGGKRLNPSAFAIPAVGQVGDAPRNYVRGFGAWQMDLGIRREFPIRDRLRLQFRAEAFNVFNHPNFGIVNTSYCGLSDPSCTFGEATATLAQSLGGLNPTYQMGGPRSLQFALHLLF